MVTDPQTNKQTNKQDITIHCAAKLSAQCKYSTVVLSVLRHLKKILFSTLCVISLHVFTSVVVAMEISFVSAADADSAVNFSVGVDARYVCTGNDGCRRGTMELPMLEPQRRFAAPRCKICRQRIRLVRDRNPPALCVRFYLTLLCEYLYRHVF